MDMLLELRGSKQEPVIRRLVEAALHHGESASALIVVGSCCSYSQGHIMMSLILTGICRCYDVLQVKSIDVALCMFCKRKALQHC